MLVYSPGNTPIAMHKTLGLTRVSVARAPRLQAREGCEDDVCGIAAAGTHRGGAHEQPRRGPVPAWRRGWEPAGCSQRSWRTERPSSFDDTRLHLLTDSES
jgi:hypothetical protein